MSGEYDKSIRGNVSWKALSANGSTDVSDPSVAGSKKLEASVNGRGFASYGFNWSFGFWNVHKDNKSCIFLL